MDLNGIYKDLYLRFIKISKLILKLFLVINIKISTKQKTLRNWVLHKKVINVKIYNEIHKLQGGI